MITAVWCWRDWPSCFYILLAGHSILGFSDEICCSSCLMPLYLAVSFALIFMLSNFQRFLDSRIIVGPQKACPHAFFFLEAREILDVISTFWFCYKRLAEILFVIFSSTWPSYYLLQPCLPLSFLSVPFGNTEPLSHTPLCTCTPPILQEARTYLRMRGGRIFALLQIVKV